MCGISWPLICRKCLFYQWRGKTARRKAGGRPPKTVRRRKRGEALVWSQDIGGKRQRAVRHVTPKLKTIPLQLGRQLSDHVGGNLQQDTFCSEQLMIGAKPTRLSAFQPGCQKVQPTTVRWGLQVTRIWNPQGPGQSNQDREHMMIALHSLLNHLLLESESLWRLSPVLESFVGHGGGCVVQDSLDWLLRQNETRFARKAHSNRLFKLCVHSYWLGS